MIKWSESNDGDVLYEAFLPEHEEEPCHWLIRASCRGHILAERTESLTWPPRFGPDVDDVAVLRGLTDTLAKDLTPYAMPDGEGNYAPAPVEVPQPEPILHALQYALIQEYVEAEVSIGLTDAQSAAYLNFPVVAGASGLYPMAVTPQRDHRMRGIVALDRLLKDRPDAHAFKSDLLSAVLADDIARVRVLLEGAGIVKDGDESSKGDLAPASR